jgi:HlyD family secretion protein
MSAQARRGTLDPPALAPVSGERQRRPLIPWLLTAVVVLAGAGAGLAVSGPFSTGGTSQSGVSGSADPTSLYTVQRGTISSQIPVTATLGYAGSYSVVNQAAGTLTAVPAAGQLVRQGQVLYQVSGAPVVLLYGPTPAYRTLSSGLTGADVAELNADLVSLGDATRAEIPAGSDTFTSATATALEKLQAALGLTQNGTLTLGQAVFVPGAFRVTTVSATLGGRAQAGQPIMAGTSTTREVTIDLDAAQQSQVKAGDQVTITLPDGSTTTPGVISSVGTVATTPPPSQGGGNTASPPTIAVLVKPADPAATGTWDQAPVNVTITTGSVSNVLVVPVDALLAQPGAGYAVEVVGTDGIHRLVPVTLGLFDDAGGLVQVSGPGLAAGQRVVVPAL